GGQRGPAYPLGGGAVVGVRQRYRLTVDVGQFHEVQAGRCVDLVSRGELRVNRERLAGLSGDVLERDLRGQPVRPAQVVFAGHAVVPAAGDVDRAEVDHTGEAVRQARVVEAVRVAGYGYLEQHAAQRVVDLLVVVVLRLAAQCLQQWTELQGRYQVGVEERE